MSPISEAVLNAAATLRDTVRPFVFKAPVAYTYNPLTYAWKAHMRYIQKWAASHKRVLFLGMNPGPFGMAQTGIPFGEVAAVRDWIGVETPIGKPSREHPKRPIEGFACQRSEVSGRRLWGLFAQRFSTAEAFFTDHFVVNYCPLIFIEAGGRNRTPDKLSARELTPLYAACDDHVRCLVETLRPEWLIGIGAFAEARLLSNFRKPQTRDQETVFTGRLKDQGVKIARILHPSPASPASNRDWAGNVESCLQKIGVWT